MGIKADTYQALFFGLSLLLILVAKPIYRDDLFNYSLTLIPWLQSGANSTIILISEIVSVVGEGIVYLPFLYGLIFSSRSSSYFYLIVSLLIAYMVAIGKILYHEPRPYMVSTTI